MRCLAIVSLSFSLLCSQLLASDDTAVATTDDGRSVYMVPRIASGIRVDGVLDDEVWESALLLELNYEFEPGENVPPPVRTEVMLAYDDNNFYAAFRCYDPDTSAIRSRYWDHDNCFRDDTVAVILDTFDDERRSYILISNPVGSQYDAIKTQQGEDSSWDAIWESAGRIYDWGYSVEMVIPFSSLRFQRSDGNQVWGFDAWRAYPRSFRHLIGLVPFDRSNNCLLCQMVKIEGFEGADPGRNTEINPTITAVRTDERADLPGGDFERANQEAEVGITVRWGITPNMTLSATANPDFSQVEADALQLDINEPFALYYQERRPFFTEGADFFSHPMLDVVYTRTMRDPLWGFKLTGKEGANTLGAYIVRDDLTNLIFPGSQGSSSTSIRSESTAAVFRYKRDIGSRYTLGVFLTDREGENYFNRVFEFDGHFRLTDTDEIKLQVFGTSTRYPDEVAAQFGQPQGGFSDRAITFEYDHETRNVGWWFDFEQVGAGFRADLGFVPRVDYRNYEGGLWYDWIAQPGSWWSGFGVHGYFSFYDDLRGNLLSRNGYLSFTYRGLMQSYAQVNYRFTQEAYGGLEFDQNLLQINTNFRPTADLYAGFYGVIGDRIDYANTRPGRRIRLNPYAEYRLGIHLRLILDHTFERMNVDGGRLYTANITQAMAVYQFSRRALLRSILQYVDYRYNSAIYNFEINPVYRRFFTQLLFSYKINPRTVLFLGYTDNYYGSHEFGLTQADRTFFVKLGYAWVL